MPKDQAPVISTPSAEKTGQPEVLNVQDIPGHPAEPPVGDATLTDVPLEDTPANGEQPADRGFQAAGEAGTSQSRDIPGVPELPKGMWGRVKNFFKKELIRMLCGEQFVKPPRRKTHHRRRPHARR